jgi:hypothetical protein
VTLFDGKWKSLDLEAFNKKILAIDLAAAERLLATFEAKYPTIKDMHIRMWDENQDTGRVIDVECEEVKERKLLPE